MTQTPATMEEIVLSEELLDRIVEKIKGSVETIYDEATERIERNERIRQGLNKDLDVSSISKQIFEKFVSLVMSGSYAPGDIMEFFASAIGITVEEFLRIKKDNIKNPLLRKLANVAYDIISNPHFKVFMSVSVTAIKKLINSTPAGLLGSIVKGVKTVAKWVGKLLGITPKNIVKGIATVVKLVVENVPALGVIGKILGGIAGLFAR